MKYRFRKGWLGSYILQAGVSIFEEDRKYIYDEPLIGYTLPLKYCDATLEEAITLEDIIKKAKRRKRKELKNGRKNILNSKILPS